jgi:hypothetical protein
MTNPGSNESTDPQPNRADCRAAFAERLPSVGWEYVALPTNPPLQLLVWYKPSHLPTAIVLQVPPESVLYQIGFTIRHVLQALGLTPTAVPMCSLFGYSFSGDNGTSAFFDHLVTGPTPGADPNIVIYVDTPRMAAAPPQSAASDGRDREIFKSLERDWKTCSQAERQLAGLTKQLQDMQTRLNTMNRDLGPDERMFSDRADIDDWRDARRFLREAATRLSKYIKEMMAGETVYAGKRAWFEQIHREYVATQTPFPGMAEARSEFEYFRRTLQNLADRMQSAYHHAQMEGVQRAQVVLTRIQGKVAAGKSKR